MGDDFAQIGSSEHEIHNLQIPMDLTIPQAQVVELPRPIIHRKKNHGEMISIAEVFENLYYDENNSEHSLSTFASGNSSSTDDYNMSSYNENQEFLVALDYSVHGKISSEGMYERPLEMVFRSIGTNTDPLTMADSGTQTNLKETAEKPVQTDQETNLSLDKNERKSNKKLSCCICHRVYGSKVTHDRHLRTHFLVANNQQIVSNVRFTTEAKLQFYKKREMSHKQTYEPIIIQMPTTNKAHCKYCKKRFDSQKEVEDHLDDCIGEPFEMIKCPECSIRFYTVGCLNQHVDTVHKNPTSTNAYYCIFCNEHFDAAFTFQVHLDKHLSP